MCLFHCLAVVDTKFEFGKDENGNILLIDEILTPDSSRFWASATYEERMAADQEPENFDKEFLRRELSPTHVCVKAVRKVWLARYFL